MVRHCDHGASRPSTLRPSKVIVITGRDGPSEITFSVARLFRVVCGELELQLSVITRSFAWAEFEHMGLPKQGSNAPAIAQKLFRLTET